MRKFMVLWNLAAVIAVIVLFVPTGTHANCTNITDCKDDRVCEGGRCVDPGQIKLSQLQTARDHDHEKPGRMGERHFRHEVTAYDLEGNWLFTSSDAKGTWVVTRNDNYQIAIRATSSTTFIGKYITGNNDNTFEGSIHGSRIMVKQRYSNGQHYATYTFTDISPKRLTGSCVDIHHIHSNPLWEKMGERRSKH